MRHVGRQSKLLLLSVCLMPFVSAQTEETILNNFFDSAGGENWIEKTNWKTSSSICSWFGITCLQGETSVAQISLNQNNLDGSIPLNFWKLPNLQSIQMRGNLLTGAGFQGLQTSDPSQDPRSPIQQIVLSENALTNITGIGFASSTLVNLNLNKNQIATTLPAELFDLTNMETLYIAFNQFSGTIPTLIGKLSRLTELYAFDNSMTGPIPSEIGMLDRCQILGLGNNEFTGSLPTEMNQMINIRDMSIHHAEDPNSINTNPGVSGPLLSFGDMPFLTLLFLDGNSLSGAIPSDFLRHNNNTGVPISIGLANNNLTGTLPVALERFESLSIDLVGNQISGIPSELCNLGGWMGGLVEVYKCDAILCPLQTYNEQGRATDAGQCEPCTDSLQFLGSTTCSSSPSETVPWKILAGFYQSTSGEKWVNSMGWNILNALNGNESAISGIDVCNGWYGVICENGNITEISLPKNDLFGTIPDSIFAIPTLRIFDVSGNNVVLGDFKGVSNAKNLTALVLSDIKVQSLEGLGDMPGLRLLYLDGIALSQALPPGLFNLTGLRILHLQHGSFVGTLPSQVGQLSNLEL